MARWLAAVTHEANSHKIDGQAQRIRDNQAGPTRVLSRQHGTKRRAEEQDAPNKSARIGAVWQCPRMAALRERVLSRVQGT